MSKYDLIIDLRVAREMGCCCAPTR